MLSDEEREALQYFNTETKTEAMHYGAVLVKSIEKQSKEIEELKEENKEIRDWKYVIDNPIDLKKLSELDLIKIFGKVYIAEDKIKAKIEEVDYKMIAHQDIREAVKQVLNSLLEKE